MKTKLLAIVIALTFILSNSMSVVQGSSKSKDIENQKEQITEKWAESSMSKFFKDGIIFKDNNLKPNKAITRSQFVTILHKALKIQINYFKATDIKDYFNDVSNNAPYASALIDLVTTNIVDFKGSFRPNDVLTREELVHFIMNAYKYKMGDNFKQIKIAYKPFADDSKLNPLYQGDVARAAHMNLILRPKNNKFCPKDKATVAQAVVMIDRLLRVVDRELKVVVKVTPTFTKQADLYKMKLKIMNESNRSVTINHSSGQKFDFKILDANRNILYTWSMDKSFIMSTSQTVIEAGKSVEFEGDLAKSQFDAFTTKPVFVKVFITGTSNDFKINPNGYEIKIK